MAKYQKLKDLSISDIKYIRTITLEIVRKDHMGEDACADRVLIYTSDLSTEELDILTAAIGRVSIAHKTRIREEREDKERELYKRLHAKYGDKDEI
jgi:hypothetical protein